ncbi:17723_t:CDS:2, partial [Funneliformis geosporum]
MATPEDLKINAEYIRMADQYIEVPAMRSLGDKISSIIAANVPMIDWSVGGGEKGIIKVENQDNFKQAFAQIQGEVPGSLTFITRLAPDAHHLEVQVLAIQYRNAISLFGRDCSGSTSVEAFACGVTFFFVGGVDKEKMTQLQIAMEIPLHQIRDIRSLQTQRRPVPKGHVITVRITVENPDAGFKPSSGMSNYLKPKLSKNSFIVGWLDENLTADKPDKMYQNYEVVIMQPPQLQLTIYETKDEQE